MKNEMTRRGTYDATCVQDHLYFRVISSKLGTFDGEIMGHVQLYLRR